MIDRTGRDEEVGSSYLLAGVAFVDGLAYRRDYGAPLTTGEWTDLDALLKTLDQVLDTLRTESTPAEADGRPRKA